MELEISPEPDDAERRAIVAALCESAEVPSIYTSPWRLTAIAEALEPDDST
jgi:hypothetical protein